MNFAFLVSERRTLIFFAVAQNLSEHNTFWISPNATWTRWLLEKGVAENQVLDLTRYSHEWSRSTPLSAAKMEELDNLEKAGDRTIKNIILIDRKLRHKPYPYALSYLYVVQHYVRDFLVSRGIEAVFSEQTHAFELITAQVCQELAVALHAPHTVRIPDGRFAFLRGSQQSEVEPIREVTGQDLVFAEAFFDKFVAEKPKPNYFHKNSTVPKPTLSWISKTFYHARLMNTDFFDESRPSLRDLVINRSREVWNARSTALLKPFTVPELPPKRPFVLLTLHKQPEATIDVLGDYLSNQLELAKTVARSLPTTHDLYVKEHQNALGDRSLLFYQALKSIPGLKLIDPFLDSFTLLPYTSLVMTVSGTVAYEAALLGIPAITFAEMFFGPLLFQNGLNPYTLSAAGFRQLLQRRQTFLETDDAEKREASINFLAWIHAQSFPGEVGGPGTEEELLENARKVTEGFRRFLEVLEAKRELNVVKNR